VDAATGLISTIAGNGAQSSGGDGGAPTDARLNAPSGVALDGMGNILVAEWFASCIRRVDVNTGLISTVAGGGGGDDGGLATNANRAITYGLAIDISGGIFIADGNNHRIRFVDPASGIISTVAGNGIQGFSGDGGQAISASLSSPVDLAVDSAGNLYIADQWNQRVRSL
jgi:hypothetical protein